MCLTLLSAFDYVIECRATRETERTATKPVTRIANHVLCHHHQFAAKTKAKQKAELVFATIFFLANELNQNNINYI